MNIPLNINSITGMQQQGVVPRTGICYGYVINTASAQICNYALFGTNGVQIGSTKTSGTLIASGGSVSFFMSAQGDISGNNGILVAWLSGSPDNGNQNDLVMLIDILTPSLVQQLPYFGFYPPDLRNIYSNHPCSQEMNVTANGTNTNMIFINPNFQCSGVTIGNASTTGLSSLSGTKNYINTLSTGMTGYYYQDATHHGAITSGINTYFDGVLFSQANLASMVTPFNASPSLTLNGALTEMKINSQNELDILCLWISGGLTCPIISQRYYT